MKKVLISALFAVVATTLACTSPSTESTEKIGKAKQAQMTNGLVFPGAVGLPTELDYLSCSYDSTNQRFSCSGGNNYYLGVDWHEPTANTMNWALATSAQSSTFAVFPVPSDVANVLLNGTPCAPGQSVKYSGTYYRIALGGSGTSWVGPVLYTTSAPAGGGC